MKIQYTQGPWTAHDGGVGANPDITIVSDVTNGIVADIPGGKPAERWANARLIAAAPDLLMALKRITELRAGEPGAILEFAQSITSAVIAKTVGK